MFKTTFPRKSAFRPTANEHDSAKPDSTMKNIASIISSGRGQENSMSDEYIYRRMEQKQRILINKSVGKGGMLGKKSRNKLMNFYGNQMGGVYNAEQYAHLYGIYQDGEQKMYNIKPKDYEKGNVVINNNIGKIGILQDKHDRGDKCVLVFQDRSFTVDKMEHGWSVQLQEDSEEPIAASSAQGQALFKEQVDDGSIKHKNFVNTTIKKIKKEVDKQDDPFIPKNELEKGIQVEKEHVNTVEKLAGKNLPDDKVAKAIALDHLKENKDYYSKLSNNGGKEFLISQDSSRDAVKILQMTPELHNVIGKIQSESKYTKDTHVLVEHYENGKLHSFTTGSTRYPDPTHREEGKSIVNIGTHYFSYPITHITEGEDVKIINKGKKVLTEHEMHNVQKKPHQFSKNIHTSSQTTTHVENVGGKKYKIYLTPHGETPKDVSQKTGEIKGHGIFNFESYEKRLKYHETELSNIENELSKRLNSDNIKTRKGTGDLEAKRDQKAAFVNHYKTGVNLIRESYHKMTNSGATDKHGSIDITKDYSEDIDANIKRTRNISGSSLMSGYGDLPPTFETPNKKSNWAAGIQPTAGSNKGEVSRNISKSLYHKGLPIKQDYKKGTQLTTGISVHKPEHEKTINESSKINLFHHISGSNESIHEGVDNVSDLPAAWGKLYDRVLETGNPTRSIVHQMSAINTNHSKNDEQNKYKEILRRGKDSNMMNAMKAGARYSHTRSSRKSTGEVFQQKSNFINIHVPGTTLHPEHLHEIHTSMTGGLTSGQRISGQSKLVSYTSELPDIAKQVKKEANVYGGRNNRNITENKQNFINPYNENI